MAKIRGIELIFMKEGEYAFKAEKSALKRLLEDSIDNVHITTEKVYISNSIWEDGKERKMWYEALKVIAKDKIGDIEHRYLAYTLH
jgi:hypothetical protein